MAFEQKTLGLLSQLVSECLLSENQVKVSVAVCVERFIYPEWDWNLEILDLDIDVEHFTDFEAAHYDVWGLVPSLEVEHELFFN